MIDPVTVRRPLGDNASTATLYYGADCRETLRGIPEKSVHTVVTSPPYFGLRDYGTGDAQIGLEKTPQAFVAQLVEVFREVRRVLRDDGTLWLNLGDSYANDTKWGGSSGGKHAAGLHGATGVGRGKRHTGLKSKDLIGIPWMVAFALRADGWYLRSDIIWSKSSCMPESVKDRPTKAHEYLFLLSKQPKYFYDSDAIRVPVANPKAVAHGLGSVEAWSATRNNAYGLGDASKGQPKGHAGTHKSGKNKRSVWNVNPKPYPGAHFAVFPPELIKPCILAGTSAKGCCPDCGNPWERTGSRGKDAVTWRPTCECDAGDPVGCTVLDPFSGSATTGFVALNHGRDYVGLDLSDEYRALAEARLLGERPPKEDENGDDGILEFFGVEDS